MTDPHLFFNDGRTRACRLAIPEEWAEKGEEMKGKPFDYTDYKKGLHRF
jgi:hypothetical protein